MGVCQRIVLVGVDFTEMGDDAILEGLRQVTSGAAQEARFVYVIDPRVLREDPERASGVAVGELLARATAALRQRVRDVAALAELPVDGVTLRAHARVGHPVATLIHACVEQDADLLIVGTHARLELDRRILGPVADALVRRAPCPVLVARPKSHRNYEVTRRSHVAVAARAPQTQSLRHVDEATRRAS